MMPNININGRRKPPRPPTPPPACHQMIAADAISCDLPYPFRIAGHLNLSAIAGRAHFLASVNQSGAFLLCANPNSGVGGEKPSTSGNSASLPRRILVLRLDLSRVARATRHRATLPSVSLQAGPAA